MKLQSSPLPMNIVLTKNNPDNAVNQEDPSTFEVSPPDMTLATTTTRQPNTTSASISIWADPAPFTHGYSSEESIPTSPTITRQPAKPTPATSSPFQTPLRNTSADPRATPTFPTPTISGHHYPSYSRINTRTYTQHIHISLSPIRLNTSNLNETQFECNTQFECQTPNVYSPYISIMNDTYLITHNI